jgi:hypothetical protein
VIVEEPPNRAVERVGGFDVADVPGVRPDDQCRPGDRPVEVLGDGEGRANVPAAVHQQRRVWVPKTRPPQANLDVFVDQPRRVRKL